MPAPTDFSGMSGEPRVYARRHEGQFSPAGEYVREPDWIAESVEIGSKDRLSTATIRFNRDRVLRGEIDDPVITPDAVFAIGYKNPGDTGSGPGVILFEGIPSQLSRQITVNSDSGRLELVSAVEAWAGAIESQISGAGLAKLNDQVDQAGVLVLDESVPTIFNPDGRPNRSALMLKDTYFGASPAFTAQYQNAHAHYFTMPGGMDVGSGPSAEISAVLPRYWTYAQAIAYVLTAWCRNGSAHGQIVRNGIKVDFGDPADVGDPGNETLLWDVIAPLVGIEAPGEDYESATPPPPLPALGFDPSVGRLLTAKVNNLSIDGLNCIEALALLCHAAGLGWWIDSYVSGTNIDILADDCVHRFRVWSPGGNAIAGGVGSQFVPKLQPYGTNVSGQTAASVLAANNVVSIDAGWDSSRIVNRPCIMPGPALYEITVELRPGWKPVHDAEVFFLDSMYLGDDETVTDPGMGARPKLEVAKAEALQAFVFWTADPNGLYGQSYPGLSDMTGSGRRLHNLCKMLHAKGPFGSDFYDILRKWIVPTDWSYPTAQYKRDRDDAPGNIDVPDWWKTYRPIDWTQAIYDEDGNPTGLTSMETPLYRKLPRIPDPFNPGQFLPGPETWPHRRRVLLPCLCADASGKSIGYKVELNFERGDNEWFEWPSFSILEDECGVLLNFDNPADVRPGNVEANPSERRQNILMAYLHNDLRVRVTATIESSEPRLWVPPAMSVGWQDRARITVRRDRYVRQVVASIHTPFTTPFPEEIVPHTVDPDDPSPRFVFRFVDDVPGTMDEANRLQALQGDFKASGRFVIPWVETDARPGLYVNEVQCVGDPGLPQRNIIFKTDLGGGVSIAPHIAGVVYLFGAGGHRTLVALDDWRSIAELDVPR